MAEAQIILSHSRAATPPHWTPPPSAPRSRSLDHSWRRFPPVLDHATTLLKGCRLARRPRPEDATALSRLTEAVLEARALLEGVIQGSVAPQGRPARAWPVIQTWLTDGERFLRQARFSAPRRRPALPVSAPARPLTARARPAQHGH
ncbi:hypothetical protein ACFWN1_05415 [Streptomyces sp. NPDC058459]|uniref:hypothetical protein n=1 Tax=Streptomyces sp. NPDC058459 TaxID=3346508 RepID=UPI00364BF4D4